MTVDEMCGVMLMWLSKYKIAAVLITVRISMSPL